MTIWKFKLELDCHINMPKDAKILCVQAQGDAAYLWAIVNPACKLDELESRHFKTYGTGHEMPNNPGTYIGTFQIAGDQMAGCPPIIVCHVFEDHFKITKET